MMCRLLTVIAGALLLAACSPAPPGEEAAHHDHDAHEAEPSESAPAGVPLLRIDAAMLRDLRITTSPAEERASGDGVTVLGELRVNEDAYAEVGPSIAARIVAIMAAPGDAVTAQQPLAELESPEFGKARADFHAAGARAALAEQTLARRRSLAAERIVPAREVQEAEAEAGAAAAALRAARAALEALGVTDDAPERSPARFVIRSPIAGTVVARDGVRGQMADPTRPLFRVADLRELWLIVHAFERDALRVPTGAAARVTFPALPGERFSGTIKFVGREVDVRSRTIPVRIDVRNDDGRLRPGMSGAAWVPLGDASGTVVAVPAASLQRLREGWCVFVPRGAGAFEARAVGRGRDLGGEIEVLSGLRPGEPVVVEGAFLLKAEAEKASGAGAHHHH